MRGGLCEIGENSSVGFYSDYRIEDYNPRADDNERGTAANGIS